MAVFGLIMALASGAFGWKASSEFSDFFEKSESYINGIPKSGEDYEKFAKKTNEAIAIYNDVGGDLSKLTKRQKLDITSILAEVEVLKGEADRIINRNPAKRMFLNSRLERYKLAKLISFTGIILGLLVSGMGFYLWHTRLQLYIDKLHRENST
jgi:esterase/lipase